MEGWISIEPTDEGGFVIELDRSDGLWMKATVELINGRPRCHKLELRSTTAPIDRPLLQSLSLASLLQRAAGVVPGARVPLEKHGLNEALLRQVADAYKRGMRERPSRPRKAVGELWIDLAKKRGENPPDEAPPSTVGRWIKAAEDRDLLPKTIQGRARGISQRSRNARGGSSTTPRLRKR